MEDLTRAKDFSSNDIVIPVMGVTGSGKSTFISRCTGVDSGVSHSLNSFTRKVAFGTLKHEGRIIRLIDTPGFDDTDFNDIDILKEISTWLLLAFNHNPPLQLSGVIFLHPITSTRMKGTDQTTLAMFQALCGRDSLASVVLATTMWSKVNQAVGLERVKDFSSKHWHKLTDAGAIVVKHEDTSASALSIVDRILQQDRRITLTIQKELSTGMDLSQTEAGQELSRKLIDERTRAADRLSRSGAELEDALKRSDEEDAKELMVNRMRYQQQLQAKEKELQEMQTDMETMLRERTERMQQDQRDREKQRLADEARLAQFSQTLESITAGQAALQNDSLAAKFEAMSKEELKLQRLESDKHDREMKEQKRHQEMLRSSQRGVAMGATGAVVGGVGAAAAVGSLAFEACKHM